MQEVRVIPLIDGDVVNPADFDWHFTFGVDGQVTPNIVCSKIGGVFTNCRIVPTDKYPLGVIACELGVPDGGWPEGNLFMDSRTAVDDPNYEGGEFITYQYRVLGIRFRVFRRVEP